MIKNFVVTAEATTQYRVLDHPASFSSKFAYDTTFCWYIVKPLSVPSPGNIVFRKFPRNHSKNPDSMFHEGPSFSVYQRTEVLFHISITALTACFKNNSVPTRSLQVPYVQWIPGNHCFNDFRLACARHHIWEPSGLSVFSDHGSSLTEAFLATSTGRYVKVIMEKMNEMEQINKTTETSP